jgi:hypothetical protein
MRPLALGSIVLIAACGQAQQDAGAGRTLVASLVCQTGDASPAPVALDGVDAAVVSVPVGTGRTTLRLSATPVASGFAFVGDGAALRGKGYEATLTIGDESFACAAP